MELKKSSKADLQNKKGMFLEIGLTLSLLVTIALFSWSQKDKVIEKLDLGGAKMEEEIMDVTVQDQKPPEAPPQAKTIAVTSDILRVVKNDAKITSDFDFGSEFDENAAVNVPKPTTNNKPEEKVEEEEIFLVAETMPSFQGGDLNGFRAWVQGKLKYPALALDNQIQGRVVLTFVVDKTGKVTKVQVLQAPDKSLGEEAVRVVESSPSWSPGKQRGNAVQIRYNMPVEFKIQ